MIGNFMNFVRKFTKVFSYQNKTCICGKEEEKCQRLTSINNSQFVVEKILKHNFQRDQGWYFVKWKGFDAVCNQWVDEAELFGKYHSF